MNIFSKRPLFCACMLYLLTSVVGIFTPPGYKIILISVFILLGLFALAFYIFDKIKAYYALCIILSSLMIVISLISTYMYFDVKAKSFEKYYDSHHTLEAIVVSEDGRSANWVEYEIYVTKIDGEEKEHKAKLSCTYSSVLEPGMSFVADLYADGFEESSGSYSEKLDMFSSEIFIRYSSEDESTMLITEEQRYYKNSLFNKINSYFTRIFKSNLDSESAAMSSALLLGNKSDLPLTVTRNFNRAGVSHILALSGMHMTIIMGLFMLLLKKLRIHRNVIAITLSVFAVLYLFITGCSLSATRSVIMLLIFYASLLFSSSPDPLTSLGIAGAFIMITMPGTVFNAGFWMSFAATLGLIVYMPAFNGIMAKLLNKYDTAKILLKPLTSFLSALVASFCAMVPMVIVMCIFIRQISWFTPLSSAILAIPSSGAILFSLLFIPFHAIPVVSDVLANLLRNITLFMTDFCSDISAMEGIVVSINYPFARVAAIVIAIALFCSLAIKFKKAILSFIPFVISIAMFVTCIAVYDSHAKNDATVSYCNVSTVSDMLVLSRDKQAIICDLGNGSFKSYAEALDSVYSARATEIKAVILTKYYRATPSTLLTLFSSNMVRELWIPKPTNTDEYNKMLPLIPVAEKCGVKVYVYSEGEELIAFSGIKINILRSRIERSTVPIIAININAENKNLLYCSSGFNECGSDILNGYVADADYIIFGNVGPKVKETYSLPQKNTADLIVFADKTHAAYFKSNKTDHATFALVDGACNVRLTSND